MSAGAGGAAAGAAAAAAALQAMREEEEMTSYTSKDLAEGWEFKILRSSTGAFKDPAKFRAALEEEKRGGWTLVEKFDNSRIRLKRPANVKMVESDLSEGYDPYRTNVGPSEPMLALLIVGCIVGALLLLALIISVIG